jgi:molecular chaperone Hsp33
MDTILKALARNGAIRIFVADTTLLVREAAERHQCYPTAAAALGRTMSAGALLAAFLKGEDEKVTIQINGGGPLGTILVDANGKGDIRGFVANPEVHFINPVTGKLDVGRAVGHEGTLRVIRDMSLRTDFTGTVALQTGEIAEDFAYYFTLSEQTPSAVSLGVLVDKDSEVKASGAVMIQMMPAASDADIEAAEKAVASLRPISTMIDEGMTPVTIAKQLFDDTVILEEHPLRFACTCSKERMADALKTLEQDELAEMIDIDHGCEITCHFCNTSYHFTETDLSALRVIGQ